ncbi:MAG: RidA family protein [Coriobacteriia bacterium]|nr:RidA family protein [Coriobacteriia bacterium]MBN2840803.1 RidA family protein [Coriobacteriia bacterium]
MDVNERLARAGHVLPAPAAPVGAYVPAARTGNLVFTSGQIPLRGGEVMATGFLGESVSEELARECAIQCVLNALAAASTVCDLEDVVRVVKLTGYVASAPGFTAQPRVIDAASELLVNVFGEEGRHAREAVGVAGLPIGVPVELSLVLEVRA